MVTRALCAIDEWYHCFNRGTDKRMVFLDEKDYERFLMLLYASNGTNPIWISSKISPVLEDFLKDESIERGEPLVEIGAYALMPNHPHIVLKQIRENGIARFMQKVFTGYTMYFNLKYSRTGALFAGTYKAKHISNDTYLKKVISYVLMNPAELFESEWKKGVANIDTLEKKLLGYRYSSLPDFFGIVRTENKIITDIGGHYDSVPNLNEMLSEAQEYYQD
ncbi:MAG: transposase [bacterium]|nr:transposase [bacterium]